MGTVAIGAAALVLVLLTIALGFVTRRKIRSSRRRWVPIVFGVATVLAGIATLSVIFAWPTTTSVSYHPSATTTCASGQTHC